MKPIVVQLGDKQYDTAEVLACLVEADTEAFTLSVIDPGLYDRYMQLTRPPKDPVLGVVRRDAVIN